MSLDTVGQMNIWTSKEVLIMCPRPVQTQARQNTSMESGGGHEVPLLNKVLYVDDNFSEECQF